MNPSKICFASLAALAGSFSLHTTAAASAQDFPVIVVFKEAPAPAGSNRPTRLLDNPASDYLDTRVTHAVRDMERVRGFSSTHIFGSALRGFAARLNAKQILALEEDPRVAYVEADGIVHIVAQRLPWGVDRVDADRSSAIAGNGSGALQDINAYVIDTGIDTRHTDLKVAAHVNFAGGVNTDCNGHGTHVAGTIAALDNASHVVGVAPGARLTGVKVMDCAGVGLMSNVIKGVDWVTANAAKPAVANLSLAGGASQALDDAVRRSAASGVFYAVAAGNDAKDACLRSPARAGAGTDNGIMTIAATDSYNKEASFSNFGACVDAWAPGVSIQSTSKGGATSIYSGTSMASPHVAGGAAVYLSSVPGANPVSIEAALRSQLRPTGTASKNGRAIQLLNIDNF